MKSTKIMLAVIATFLTTWFVMGSIGWALSDLSLKDCLTHGGTLMLLLIFGWVPSVIIAHDLDAKLF